MKLLLDALRAVAEKTRLRLLVLLSNNELTVSEISYIIDQSQPRVSRHLKVLCEAQVIDRIQEGAWVFYRVSNQQPGKELSTTLLELIDFDDDFLKRDSERLTIVREEHSRKAESYFKTNAHEWEELRRHYISNKAVEQAMLDSIKDRKIDNLLDMGTGTGRMLEVFSSVIHNGVGIDVNQEMLTIARSRLEKLNLNHCQVRQGNIHNIALSDASFDLIIIHHVLHYLNNPSVIIDEASRLLMAKGRLLIVDFAPHDLEKLRQEHAHRRLGFADKEISRWCKEANLTVKNVQNLGSNKSPSQLNVSLWIADKL